MVTVSKISRLLEEEKSSLRSRVKDLRAKWYLASYPYFVDYFKNLEKIEARGLIHGIAMVYSWMPTIPGVKCSRLLTEGNLKLANDLFKNKIEEERKR